MITNRNPQRPLNSTISRRARENAERAAAQKTFTKEAKATVGTDMQKIAALFLKQQGEPDEQS
jgi:hypothetical protein